MQRSLIIIALALALPATVEAGNPWEELMGPGKPRTWTDPSGRFSIDLLINWKAIDSEDKTVMRFQKTNASHRQTGYVSVEVRTLPPGVKLSHFALRAESELKQVARNLNKGQASGLRIAGKKAKKTDYSYQERGHVLRTNFTRRVVLVHGERGWVISFLSAYGAQGLFLEEFDKMVTSFNPGAAGRRIKRGKKRKRLRAGEMVNPDLLKY
jgi:hypothetical protein